MGEENTKELSKEQFIIMRLRSKIGLLEASIAELEYMICFLQQRLEEKEGEDGNKEKE